jgi:outer membrane lipoprotein-sorting protein
MKFLRTVSTRRLLALIAGFVAVALAGTAIAVAAGSGGPVPRAKPLAQAIHDALGAPAANGISARVTFTNHLIDSSSIQGSDPILTGASGRLWISSDQRRLRIELQAGNGDAQAMLDNSSFWVYDPSSNTVYRGTLPKDTAKTATEKPNHNALPSIARIQNFLTHLMGHANVSGAQPTNIAGQPAYTVSLSPKHDGGLLGSAALAWDAVHGVPLRIAVYARGSSSPVLELKVTDISYGRIPASDFSASPPSGAKVVNISVPGTGTGKAETGASRSGERGSKKHGAALTGAAAVAPKLHFKLVAPSKLVGLPQQSVRLLDWGGSPAALVTYGQNLGGIAVIEQSADSAKTSPASQSSGDQHHGLNLPTVSINGATGQELDTALGTMVRFTRAGVAYTVLGSVPPAAADAAARAL